MKTKLELRNAPAHGKVGKVCCCKRGSCALRTLLQVVLRGEESDELSPTTQTELDELLQEIMHPPQKIDATSQSKPPVLESALPAVTETIRSKVRVQWWEVKLPEEARGAGEEEVGGPITLHPEIKYRKPRSQYY
eukprot:3800341-Rhodomonas_salina.4